MIHSQLTPNSPPTFDPAPTGSRQEVDTFWREQSAQRLAREAGIPPKKTYADYVAAGKTMLEVAIVNEQVLGPDATVELYREAGIQFLGAFGNTPVDTATLEFGEPDPILELQYAMCIAKQAAATEVAPYTSPESLGRDRREDLKQIARDTLHHAWDRIFMSPDIADEVLVPAAIVTAEGLSSTFNNPEAKDVMERVRTKIALQDGSSSQMIGLIDRHVRTPETERKYTREQVAAEALLGLATDSAEVLLML